MAAAYKNSYCSLRLVHNNETNSFNIRELAAPSAKLEVSKCNYRPIDAHGNLDNEAG